MEKTYDLIVVGLGTAGAIAAITAAKRGLKTLGVERFTIMGGTATLGGITRYYFGSTGGVYEEIDKMSGDNTVFAPLILAKAYSLERAAVENGVEIMYNTTVVGVHKENGTLKGLQIMGDERMDIYAKYVIDATGDGIVCAMLGCDFSVGRELDGRSQPYTRMQINCTQGKIYASANRDFGRVDPTDCQQVSEALLSSAASFLEQDYTLPTYEGIALSPMLGVREGRLIECQQKLKLDKLLSNEQYKEPVFYAYSDVDKHGWDLALEDETLCDWAVSANLGAVNVTVAVPLGAMIPKNYHGIMAVGRCLCADHNLSSTVRMLRDMQKAGEAAAEAIALALRENVDVREIEYDGLKDILTCSGCLDESNNIGYKFDGRGADSTIIHWLKDLNQIKLQLCTDRPGVAIWSCKLMGDHAVGQLKSWLSSDDENLKKHSAIALGLLEDHSCLPILQDMISSRDDFMLQDCRKYNQLRGVIAIYLMGKLKNPGAVDQLISIVASESEFKNPVYQKTPETTRYSIPGYNDVYFQFFSHSIRTLMKLGDNFPYLRSRISDALKQAFYEDKIIERIVSCKSNRNEYAMVVNIREVVNDWCSSRGSQ